MSFDLGVWQVTGSLTAAEASRIYASLCRGETPARVVQHSSAVAAFYGDLVEKWPEAGSSDSPPWSAPIHHSGSHVLMSCLWPRIEDVYLFLGELAARHGLVLFDPQSEEVYMPEEEKSSSDNEGECR